MFPSHPPVEIHDNHVESFTDMLHQEKPMLHGNKRTTGKNSLLQKKHTGNRLWKSSPTRPPVRIYFLFYRLRLQLKRQKSQFIRFLPAPPLKRNTKSCTPLAPFTRHSISLYACMPPVAFTSNVPTNGPSTLSKCISTVQPCSEAMQARKRLAPRFPKSTPRTINESPSSTAVT